MKERTIWTNYDLNYEDWKADLEEEYPNADGYDEEYRIERMFEINDEYLDDERINLNIRTNGIVALGDIGRWNGRVSGYKEVGDKISDCLYDSCCDYCHWYVDRYKNFRMTGHHHDGTNYVLYREWKDGLSDEQKENFLNKVYYGKLSKNDISRYTQSLGKKIAEVYGW